MKRFASCIISVLIDLLLFFISLFFMIVPLGITDYWERCPVYIPEFIMCIAFIVIAFAMPVAANFLLYRFWYKRSGMSKLWAVIPFLGTYLVLGFLFIAFLISIPDWGKFYVADTVQNFHNQVNLYFYK